MGSGEERMVSFVIDEEHLRALSPSARHEVLRVLAGQIDEIKAHIADIEWYPDRDLSYPIDPEQARMLIRGQLAPMRRALRVFCANFDGEIGSAALDDLLAATRHTDHDQLGSDITTLTQSLRGITGDRDAWLINWRAEDWEWDDALNRYVKGRYFISGPAIRSLRQALSIG